MKNTYGRSHRKGYKQRDYPEQIKKPLTSVESYREDEAPPAVLETYTDTWYRQSCKENAPVMPKTLER